MQTKISDNAGAGKINWKRFMRAAVLGAFALAPIAGSSQSAEAQPDWGRDRDNRYGDRNDRFDETRTLEGVVSNDRAGREFVLLLDSGRRIQVRSSEREPRRLSDGDRVRVNGSFDRTGDRNRSNTRYNDNLIFRADDVQIIRNRGGSTSGNHYGNSNGAYSGNSSGRRTLSGIVTDIESDQRLKVRSEGREYTVRSTSRLASGVNRGERVRIFGDVRGDYITNASVALENDWNDRGRDDRGSSNGRYGSGYKYGTPSNSQVNFPATVIEASERTSTLRVRGENGREYNLRATDRDEIEDLRRGQRVMIRGRMLNGVIYIDDVDKI